MRPGGSFAPVAAKDAPADRDHNSTNEIKQAAREYNRNHRQM